MIAESPSALQVGNGVNRRCGAVVGSELRAIWGRKLTQPVLPIAEEAMKEQREGETCQICLFFARFDRRKRERSIEAAICRRRRSPAPVQCSSLPRP